VRALAFLFFATSVACVDPLTTQPSPSPAWEVKNVAGYAETAAGLPPDVVLGWDLRVAAGVARWRECAAIDDCTDVERERPAGELIAVERVGKRTTDGGDVDVVKLSLAAKPKYVVPVRKVPPR
jgi:hypothetical protein